jgi:HD-like signal output (HDOD) protein
MSLQPQDLPGWVAFLRSAEIPVLKHTARELERLHADDDTLNARSIAQTVTSDPMMTLRLLSYMQQHRRRSQSQALVQVEQAIMMMGFGTFFREVAPAPVVEDILRGQVDALLQLLQTVRLAQRASRYAFDWALLLHDLHAEEVRIATLLSSLGEMLMWCFNPQPMLGMCAMQAADEGLRSAEVQQQVLGFRGMDLQQALATEWHLPGLLLTLVDPDQAGNERVRNVMLALNLARHSANGWDNAALPDDYRDIGALLGMDSDKVMVLVGAKPRPAAC